MNRQDLHLTLGQTGKVIVNVAGSETTDPLVEGSINVTRTVTATDADTGMTTTTTTTEIQQMQVTASDGIGGELTWHEKLPIGRHLYEIRVDGRSASYGYIVVYDSPLGKRNGEEIWEMDVDLAEPVLSVELNLTGKDGAPGKSAYEIAVETGATDAATEEEWLARLADAEVVYNPESTNAQSGIAVASAIDEALYSTEYTVINSPQGTQEGEYRWYQLAAERVPSGTLSSIALQCADTLSTTVTTAPSRLAVWEMDEAGENWVCLGTSNDLQAQVAREEVVWHFSNIVLSGREMRLVIVPDGEEWVDNTCFGAVVSPVTDGTYAVAAAGGRVSVCPQYAISVYNVNTTFARPETVEALADDLSAHKEDTTVHVTENERTAWNEHEEDATIHITEEERTEWNTTPTLKEIFSASPASAALPSTFTGCSLYGYNGSWNMSFGQTSIDLAAKKDENNYTLILGGTAGIALYGYINSAVTGVFVTAEDGVSVKGTPLTVPDATADAHALAMGQAKTLFVGADAINEAIDARLRELGLLTAEEEATTVNE